MKRDRQKPRERETVKRKPDVLEKISVCGVARGQGDQSCGRKGGEMEREGESQSKDRKRRRRGKGES